MDDEQQPKRIWTAQEVAALGLYTDLGTASSVLGMSRSHGYRLARAGEFPVEVIKIGSRYRVPVRPILDLLHAEAS